MIRSLAPVVACIVAASIPSLSYGDAIEVQVTGKVSSNNAWYGIFEDVALGEPVSMSFSIDSELFDTDPAVPETRGYPIDTEGFTMSVAGIDVGIYGPEPPIYLVVAFDPFTDLTVLRLSWHLEFWHDVGVDLNGLYGTPMQLESFFLMENGVINSLDIRHAVGAYNEDHFPLSGWGLDDWTWHLIDFQAESLVIDLLGSDCPTDLDGDGAVGSTDLLTLLGAWGDNPGHPADIDGDGIVGTPDLVLLLGNWGPCR